jgi:hypothetical protein
MDSFYTIVLSIAGILLILILTVVGIMMRNLNNSTTFPQSSITCPDYWTYDTTNKVCKMGDINKGDFTSANGMNSNNTPGYDNSKGGFDPTAALWGGKYGTTVQCGKKKWANVHNINWDGNSNFNGCQ